MAHIEKISIKVIEHALAGLALLAPLALGKCFHSVQLPVSMCFYGSKMLDATVIGLLFNLVLIGHRGRFYELFKLSQEVRLVAKT